MTAFEFWALEAKFGDCIIIRWGANNSHLMLIDGGPDGVYDTRLKPVIEELRAAQGMGRLESLPIDLVAVSHIDGDHVLGIEDLLKEMKTDINDNRQTKVAIRRFWMNAFDDIVTGGGAVPQSLVASIGPTAALSDMDEIRAVVASVSQGRRTRDLARGLRLPGNLDDNSLVRGGDLLELDGEMKVTVVAPETLELNDLRDKWVAESASITMAEMAKYLDKSIPNLSSIVMLVERGGRRALLTGDARGDLILESLEKRGLLDDGSIHVDVLKVQHHGSKNNMEPDFFAKVTADHYVVSANGHHEHPSTETLEAIVDARGQDEYVIYLTNEVDHAVRTLQAAAAQPGNRMRFVVRDDREHAIKLGIDDV